jgi:hypothetical protein
MTNTELPVNAYIDPTSTNNDIGLPGGQHTEKSATVVDIIDSTEQTEASV